MSDPTPETSPTPSEPAPYPEIDPPASPEESPGAPPLPDDGRPYDQAR